MNVTSKPAHWSASVPQQPAISTYKDMNVKGVLVDMGYYEWRSQDVQPTAKTSSNGAGGHRVYVHLMQVRVLHIWGKATCFVRSGDGLQTYCITSPLICKLRLEFVVRSHIQKDNRVLGSVCDVCKRDVSLSM